MIITHMVPRSGLGEGQGIVLIPRGDLVSDPGSVGRRIVVLKFLLTIRLSELCCPWKELRCSTRLLKLGLTDERSWLDCSGIQEEAFCLLLRFSSQTVGTLTRSTFPSLRNLEILEQAVNSGTFSFLAISLSSLSFSFSFRFVTCQSRDFWCSLEVCNVSC